MKVKQLLKLLKDENPNSEIDLSRFYLIPKEENKEDDSFELILDCPIIGIASSKDETHIRFILLKDMDDIRLRRFMKKNFGKIIKV